METHGRRPKAAIDEAQDDIAVGAARVALEWVFEDSYTAIEAAALEEGVTVTDLLALGHRIVYDAIRLARGDISCIVVPNRWPRPGEHRGRFGQLWCGYLHSQGGLPS